MSILEAMGTDHCLRSIAETAARARKLELKTDHATVKGFKVTIHWTNTGGSLTDQMTLAGDALVSFRPTGRAIRAYAVTVELVTKTHRLVFEDHAAFRIIDDYQHPWLFGGFVMPSSIVITDGEARAEASYCLPEAVVGPTTRGVWIYGHVEGCRIESINELAKAKPPRGADHPKERDSFCYLPETLRKVAAFMRFYWREYDRLGNYRTRFEMFKRNPRLYDAGIQSAAQFKKAVLRARSEASPDPATGEPYLEPMHKNGKSCKKSTK